MSTRVLQAVAGLILAIGMAGCSADPLPPGDVVHAYFRFLSRDPLRTLPLLTPGFHRDHDLRLASTTEARAFLREGPPRALPDRPPESLALAVHHRQLTWLAVQQRPEFQRLAAALAIERIAEPAPAGADRVEITTRLRIPPMRAFEQRFELRRAGVGAPWRIEKIHQHGVDARNRVAAFVAHPTERTRAALVSALPSRGPGAR